MLKKILLYLVTFIAGAYIVLALLCFTNHPDNTPCKGVDIEIEDYDLEILTGNDVMTLLNAKEVNPEKKEMNKISCHKIEQAIQASSLIEDCQCFKTHNDYIGIKVSCKIPIMHVFDKDGKDFYIDKHGDIIKGIPRAIYLPVASGYIERDMADKELLTIANFLKENRFWMEQTEQIYFQANKDIIIVPRIGNHIIEIGRAENLEKKMDKLKKFYEKGLNEIGWNKYKKINVEFDNQVICTKRK